MVITLGSITFSNTLCRFVNPSSYQYYAVHQFYIWTTRLSKPKLFYNFYLWLTYFSSILLSSGLHMFNLPSAVGKEYLISIIPNYVIPIISQFIEEQNSLCIHIAHHYTLVFYTICYNKVLLYAKHYELLLHIYFHHSPAKY